MNRVCRKFYRHVFAVRQLQDDSTCMTRFGCNLRRIASLRRLSAGRGAPHAAGWPAAPPWPHPHRVRVVVAVGSGLMRVPESGVGSPFRSATSACLAVCLCRWCWSGGSLNLRCCIPFRYPVRCRRSAVVSARRGLLGCLSFRYPATATRRTELGGAHQDTARFQHRRAIRYTTLNLRYLNLALDYEL